MKLKNVVTGTLVLTLLVLSGCEGGLGRGNPTTVAEQFMDLYYHKANFQEAKALATPAAAQKIEEQFAASAGAVPGETGKSHEASYTLKEKDKLGNNNYYIYELTITTKEAGSLRKRVSLGIDWIDGAWRITQFNESAASPPIRGAY